MPNDIPQTLDYASPKTKKVKYDTLAKSTLACGILSLLCFPLFFIGPIAILLGIILICLSKDERDRRYAIWGIIGGILGLFILSIVLPSLGRPREPANRIKCASNMRQILLAIKMYANENKTLYPPDFVGLGLTQDISADVFVCPTSNDDKAANKTSDPTSWTQNLSTANHTCSYIYVPGHTDNDNADIVILYEPLDNHDKDGANFGFTDGHVDWIANPIAEKAIKEIQSGQNPPPSIK